jgi:hypothetical protein
MSGRSSPRRTSGSAVEVAKCTAAETVRRDAKTLVAARTLATERHGTVSNSSTCFSSLGSVAGLTVANPRKTHDRLSRFADEYPAGVREGVRNDEGKTMRNFAQRLICAAVRRCRAH